MAAVKPVSEPSASSRNRTRRPPWRLVPELLRWLRQRGIESRLDNETARYAGMLVGLDRAHVPEGCDLAVVLGGDGTLLSAARAVGNRAIPLLAVNLGGLGFLTSIPMKDLFPQLERALAGDQEFTRRKMLRVSLLPRRAESWRNTRR